MIFHAFLIKYAEIAIKGKNRYLFEDALVKQMKLARAGRRRIYRNERTGPCICVLSGKI